MIGRTLFFASLMSFFGGVCFATPHFPIPSMCNENAVTGSGSENSSDRVQPIVQVLASATEDGNVSVVGIEPSDVYQIPSSNYWAANIRAVANHPYYIVTTSYTPFLETVHLFENHNEQIVLPLQAHAQRQGQTDLETMENRPFSHVEVRVYDDNNQPIPYGIVEFTPMFEGSSPYTIQADADGVIQLSCVYYSIPQNHRITVLSAEHDFLYDGAIVIEYVQGTQGLAFTRKEDEE
ncbi:hypothetical protein [Marinobacter sp.]|uniref:hypothetical protein n=1 Tax=Gammaproteobacteria TaxID=1236 RepID=UPI003A8F4EBE